MQTQRLDTSTTPQLQVCVQIFISGSTEQFLIGTIETQWHVTPQN